MVPYRKSRVGPSDLHTNTDYKYGITTYHIILKGKLKGPERNGRREVSYNSMVSLSTTLQMVNS